MPILNQLFADQKPILGQFHLHICRCKANRQPNSANRMPILNQPGANPKKAIFLFHFTTLSIHANPCQSIPIFANPCQSNPIRANPRQSVQIHANLVPITNMDGRKCLNGGRFDKAKLEPLCSAVTHNGQSEPIQANPMPILANPMPISCHY